MHMNHNNINPSSSDIKLHILLTVLHTFCYGTSKEILF